MLSFLAARSRVNHSNVLPDNSYAQVVLADMPIAYWRLGDSDTIAVDATGHGHDGAYHGSTVGQASILPNGQGKSVALNGISDYISVAADAALNNMNSPCSIECWVKLSVTALQVLYGGGIASVQLALGAVGNNQPYFGQGSVSNATSSTTPLDTDTAYHLVVTSNSSGDVKYYVNGADAGGSPAYTTVFVGSGEARIATYASSSPALFVEGNMQEVAVYAYALTPTQVVNHYHAGTRSDALWNNVLSLLHCEGTDSTQTFTDEKGLTWAAGGGGTELTNDQVAFGNTALEVSSSTGPSTHAGIATSDTAGFHTGTGPLSLEWLQYWNDLSDFQNIYSYGGTASGGLLLETGNGDGKYIVYLSGSVICTESTAPSTGQWYQYSMVRDEAGVFKIARAPLGSTPVVTATSSAQVASIGIDGAAPTWGAYASGANATASIIDELRITAAVRSQDTAQTEPWPSRGTQVEDPYWSDVKLLCNFNGVDGATTTVDTGPVAKTLTMSSTTLETANPKFGTAAASFSGSGSVNAPDDGDWDVADDDFTLDGWFYQNGSGAFQQLIGIWDDFSNNNFHIGVNPANTSISFEYTLGGIYDATRSFGVATVFTVNTWTHLEFSRHGSDMNIFVNGVLVYTFNCSTDVIHYTADVVLRIGGNTLGQNFNGFLDDIRFTKGVARHTADFTPPAYEAGQFTPT